MLYKSGDKDDLGILMMSLLQSVGIQSAFICTEDDFIVLFNTEVKSSRAENFFDGTDRVIILEDDNIWIPLSMKVLNEGFINSWYNAVEEIMYVTEAEEDYYFVDLSEAWSVYPPASFSSGENVALETSEKKITESVETDISRYITAEFGPQIAAVQNRILSEGASAALYNQLGMLYVRAGMYSSAIPVYQLSAKMGSVPAMNNLGNIASLQKKYEEAMSWYKKVLEVDPENSTARANLTRIESELQSE
jgi:tetratricopeptide (TPR) repeat protein